LTHPDPERKELIIYKNSGIFIPLRSFNPVCYILPMTLKDFKEMINQTIFCAKSRLIEERRSRKEEVYLEKSRGNLLIAASDNRRLGYAILFAGNDFPDFDGVIVSADIIKKIAKRKRDAVPLSISLAGKEVNFNIGSACISTPTLTSKFPQFHRNPQDFPRLFPLSFTLDRLSLLEALKIVSVVIELWCPAVNLDLSSGTLTLFAGSDEASAEIDIPCDYSGEKAELTFNARFFTEIIENVGTESVCIRFDEQNFTAAILPAPEQDYYYFLAQRKRG